MENGLKRLKKSSRPASAGAKEGRSVGVFKPPEKTKFPPAHAPAALPSRGGSVGRSRQTDRVGNVKTVRESREGRSVRDALGVHFFQLRI